MHFLLKLSSLIDRVNERIGRWVAWAVLAAVIVSAGNAIARKFFGSGSNAWLELQWYLFGAIFLLSSGYTLLKNGHVRVDVLSTRLPRRTQVGIDIFGTLFFLLPAAVLIMVLGWPMFWESWSSKEVSSNSGGLIRWPAKLLVPIGFCLLLAAALSHLIKCIAFLRGQGPDPVPGAAAPTEEEQLAAELRARAEAETANVASTPLTDKGERR
ncbi:TRAP transporter small permease subunit [Ramlibacter rhizophilus]|uniref:TRAP transporter small permease protein n=1 Tax=Ramlibacter rhizophilus TaxID=1781167 RepID=A0A4Z0BDT2_9BURK|nr:TRAP transporter small permease subunit [Ramlibacter rhizophilus]TFY97475.1 TRAP transporter small permease subunit [Ramlibacter rhizophilus]